MAAVSSMDETMKASSAARTRMHVPGILVLYHTPCWDKVAPTVVDNYSAFAAHSRFPVWEVNTEYGFPAGLSALSFEVVVLHYTLFGRGYEYELPTAFCNYLKSCSDSRIIAFFQDEYRYCGKRFSFIDEHRVDTVYTCFSPEHHAEVYGRNTSARHIISYIPGYVSDSLVHEAGRLARPSGQRSVDVGYRARQLDFSMGKGAQEKHEIGLTFRRMVEENGLPLRLDIRIGEENRIHGENWYRFLADCKGTLGVESGVSIVDLKDEVRPACERILKEEPRISFEEMHARVLHPWEGNIQLRTISPRHFEAAAFRVCQILYEGDYSGIMQPGIHYLPLKKDFSNFHEVISRFSEDRYRNELTGRAYSDLIGSGRQSYRSFIEGFDKHLDAEFRPRTGYDMSQVYAILRRDLVSRMLKTWIRKSIYIKFPGRARVRSMIGRMKAG